MKRAERLAIKAEDRQFEETTVAKVEGGPGNWTLHLSEGFCFGGIPAKWNGTPKVGAKARFYGKGFGFPVRGLDLDGEEVYYKTADEQEAEHLKWVKDKEREDFDRFQRNKPEMDKRVAALPKVFRDRLQKFRANNADFRWKYEDYELFTCEEAVKIAAHCKTAEAVDTFSKAPWDEQKAVVSGGHSGNTFGMACYLAKLSLAHPEGVVKLHGALAPLVGSEEYGCVPKKGHQS
jgi:hypothetical protein